MFDPNLMIAPDVGGMVQQGIQQGQQNREQNMAKAAMAALAQDPNNEKAYQALASVNPEAAMQFKQQRLDQAKAQMGAHYDSVLKGGQIVRQVQPKDQASWDQTLAMAQQAGIDLSEVPRVWDENTAKYAQQLSGLAEAFKPQTEHQSRIITPQPGAGAYELGRDGTMKTLIQPNDGSHQFGAPAGDPAAPPAEAVARLRSNPHEAQQFDEIFGPGASQKVLGGQTAPAPSATFP